MQEDAAPPAAVRQATAADVPAIVDVYIRAYAQPPWLERHEPISSEGYLRWVMSQPGTFCLVSVAVAVAVAPAGAAAGAGAERGAGDGVVQGIVLAGPRAYADFVTDWERLADRPPDGWPPVPGRLGYIWEIAVVPEGQRRGQGSALLGGAIERLRAEGADAVVLRSSERAVAAVGMYRRFGFRRLPVTERIDPLSGPWLLRLDAPPPAPDGAAAGEPSR
jgi:ribosomal protein S18 acetylase RimI-like enzyme